MENVLDYIVIGGGIAGLYYNWCCTKKNLKGILLEKENYFGGRALEKKFHGTNVKMGAGIITPDNKHLLKVIDKLKIKKVQFTSTITSMLKKPFDMKNAVQMIKEIYKKEKDKITNLTVTQFLKKYFDSKFVKEFLENCEYHDFLESDVMYFIKYYKLKDMIHHNDKIYSIVWTDLVNKLVKNGKAANCMKNSMVTNIIKEGDGEKESLQFKVFVEGRKTPYTTKQIIMAVTLKPLDRLLNKVIDFSYSDYIGTVPFIRIYSYHSTPYDRSKLGGFNLVPGKLYKLIPITDKILMSAYSDNEDAISLFKLLKLEKKDQIKKVQEMLDEVINLSRITDIIIHYWDEGVHYYKPFGSNKMNKLLKKLRNPIKGIKVIGEIVSRKHGYVEGAIESVE
jgi:protoporphyrinogen oxidase